MGVRIVGLDELIHDLETLPERAPKKFRGVVAHAALEIKKDWRARWDAMKHDPTHIPHLVRGIGYDTDSDGDTYSAEIGVARSNRQAFLAEIIERGTPTSAPHPGALPALDAQEEPFLDAVAQAALDLLDGKT